MASDLGRVASSEADAEAAAQRANAYARTLPPSVRCAYEAHPHGWRPDGHQRRERGPDPPKWPAGRERWVPALWWVPPVREALKPREGPVRAPRGAVPAELEALNRALARKAAK